MPPGVNRPINVVPKKATLRRFLRLSEDVRKEMSELARLYKSRAVVADVPLFPTLGPKRDLTVRETQAMQAHFH